MKLPFLAVIALSGCGVANYGSPINEPIPIDSLEPPIRGTQVTVPEDERIQSLGVCFYDGIMLAPGSYEIGVGSGSTEFGILRCQPFEVEMINPPTIQEDDPEWDCETMGNKICGPVQLPETE